MTYGELVESARRSQAVLEDSLDSLTEVQAREPSLLPGWSRGHLITHLARNADALGRFARGVITDEPAPEAYPGGPAARAAAIEEGADRPVELLRADAEFAGRRVLDTFAQVPEKKLDTTVQWRRPVAMRFVPMLRWRELEIHHVDLGVGYTTADWPEQFVEAVLATELPAVAGLEQEVQIPDLPRHELLSWIVGRPPREGLPTLPGWPF